MAKLVLQTLPVPRPCGVCGRPTTQYSPELAMAFCGREERPAERRDGDPPAMCGGHGEHGPRRRRFLRRNPKAVAVLQETRR